MGNGYAIISPNVATTVSYTGIAQQYIVPANAASLSVTLYGAQGGNGNSGVGGKGASVTTTLVLAPCSIINVYAGGAGILGMYIPGVANSQHGAGGFNGGGNVNNVGSGSGGGATDIRTGNSLSSRIVVAGGGGGADGSCGVNGGAGGQAGSNGTMCSQCTSPGGGGTSSAGGAAGVTPGVLN